MSVELVKKLDRNELINLVEGLLHPKEHRLPPEDVGHQLNLICINCPDPSSAMDIIVETPPPVTAQELVDRALSCPPRDIDSVPFSKLSSNHPLRKMKLDQ